MNTRNPLSSTWCLAFSLALFGLSQARAQSDYTPQQKRARRLEKLVKTRTDLSKFCSEIRGWKEADAKTGVSPLSNACARLKEDDQRQLAADVDLLKDNCAALEDAETGLAALVKEGVKLEKIKSEHWDALADKLGDIVLRFQGRNAFGDSTEDHYGTCYTKDCSVPLNKCQAMNQLASFSKGQFTTGFGQTLNAALADVKADDGKTPASTPAAPDEE